MIQPTLPLLHAPAYINWHFTYRCNLNCVHCYSRSRQTTDELCTKDKLRVAENILRNRVFRVNLGGGESLLDLTCMEIIRFLSDGGVFVSVGSSGHQLNTNLLRELKHAGIGQINLSLDFSSAERHDAQRRTSGCFADVMCTLNSCREMEIPVYISTVITRQNFQELEDIFKLACHYNCLGVDLKRLRLMGNAKNLNSLLLTYDEENSLLASLEHWRRVYPLKLNLSYNFRPTLGVDNGCLCAKQLLTILADGTVSACLFNPVSLGNAINDDLGVIWRESKLLKQLRNADDCFGL